LLTDDFFHLQQLHLRLLDAQRDLPAGFDDGQEERDSERQGYGSPPAGRRIGQPDAGQPIDCRGGDGRSDEPGTVHELDEDATVQDLITLQHPVVRTSAFIISI